LVICFSVLAVKAVSQTSNGYNPAKVIPPSPTAASLGNYGNYSVGFYTGRPDISIPLYEIKTGNHVVPISLQYDASGVRVSQQASWVGLSWSLQAGGVITRTVRGLDDFGGGGHYLAPAIPPNYTAADVAYFDQVAAGTLDAEADIFNYNFGPYSGRFVIGKKADGSSIFLDQANNLQIRYIDIDQRWEVTDGQGYKYFLSTQEFAIESYNYSDLSELSDLAPLSHYNYSILPPVTTAWYLDSIASPSSEVVEFIYELPELSTRSISLPQKSENEFNRIQASGFCPSVSPRFPADFKNYSSSRQVILDKYLKKIQFQHGSIEFIRMDRNDIEYKGTEKPDRLSQILIKDLQNNLLKKYTLYHSYFFDDAIGRLRLDSLSEEDVNGNIKPPYRFSYFTNTVPGPYTKSIDHWGFFNSKANNTLIPKFNIEAVTGNYKFYAGADRAADASEDNVKKGVLSTISYPTGGATHFDYEPHEYGRLRPSDAFNFENSFANAIANPDHQWLNSSDTFTLANTTQVEVTYGYTMAIENSNDPFSDGMHYAYILYENGSTFHAFDNVDCPGSTSPCSTLTRNVVLSPGTYILKVYYYSGWQTTINARWSTKIPVTTRKGGGIRVKSIENMENGKRAGFRKFIYNSDVYGGTTGQLVSEPMYGYVFELEDLPNRAECPTYIAQYLGRSSSSISGSGLTAAATIVGYDIVTEIIGENGEGGKIEHTFINLPEAGTSHPFVPGYFSPLGGKPYQTVTFDAQGNELTKAEYRYKMRESVALRSIKLYQANYGAIASSYFIQPYFDYADCLLQTSEKKTDFGVSQPLVTEQLFYYENPEHNQLTTIKSTRTDGATLFTKLKYPGDYTGASTASFVYQMKQKNIVSPVIEEQTLLYMDGVKKLISGTFTKYKMVNAGLFVPESISKIQTASLLADTTVSSISESNQLSIHPKYREEVIFDTYTSAGKLETFHKPDGAYESYIWDYQASLPVAHAINSAATEVAYTSFESGGKGGWQFWGTVLLSAENILPTGKRFYELTNTNPISKQGLVLNSDYVISYWSMNGQFTVDGGSPVAPVKTGTAILGWSYFEHLVKATGTTITIRGTGSIDEVRLRSVSSQLNTYSYEPVVGMTSSTDTNGLTTYFEYDGFQRLKLVKDREGNILKYYKYHYSGQVISAGVSALNYIRTIDVKAEGRTSLTQVEDAGEDDATTSFQFFDGLGRPVQSVIVKGSVSKQDVVQPIAYDAFGREAIKYLPYTDSSSPGWYKEDALKDPEATGTPAEKYITGKQYGFYQFGGILAQDVYPYAETRFESSPLNRVLEQGSPGQSWQPDEADAYTSIDRTIKFAHETNGAGEVLRWRYVYPTTTYPLGSISAGDASPEYYGEHELYKTRTKDEQRHEVIEYKDKEGRIVLKRVQAVADTPVVNDTNYASTYYVYDDFGSLVCVIQPEGTKRLPDEYYHSAATLDTQDGFLKRFAFRYAYDARRRMTYKQVPGTEPEYLVYDKRDRVVLSQTAYQRNCEQWIFTKYDALNRPVLTGILDGIYEREYLQQMADGWTLLNETFGGTIHGYTNQAFPNVTDPHKYLSVNYYDNYAFKTVLWGEYDYVDENLVGTRNGITYNQPDSESTTVRGLVTGTRLKVLDDDIGGGVTWLTTVNYYDDKYRHIQTISDNYKGGADRVTNLYDFSGILLKTTTAHYVLQWKDVSNVDIAVGTIKKAASGTTWSAGAASVEMLPASQDGWVEFTIPANNASLMVGLSETNPDAVWNTIKYALYLTGSGTVQVRLSGSSTDFLGTGQTYAAGDVFRIERLQGNINFYRNGTLLLQRTATSNALLVDMSFSTSGGRIVALRSSFGSFSPLRIGERFEYDHAGRLTNSWHRINENTELLLTAHQYNELGQLVDKKLHSTDGGNTFVQSVDYRYNIRGWLSSLNNPQLSDDGITNNETNDLFGMNLAYNDEAGTGNAHTDPLQDLRQYNGNISAIRWSVNPGSGNGEEAAYNFKYDPLNHLQSASHLAKSTGAWTSGGFNEDNIGYDLNGNIKTLKRKSKGGTLIDDLTYNYSSANQLYSNQLLSVTDNTANAIDKRRGFKDGNTIGDDYTYDASGNMVTDANKGLTVMTYSAHYQPYLVDVGLSNVRNVYDASGRKLSQVTTYLAGRTESHDIGDFHYDNTTLSFIKHSEGRSVMADHELVYKYSGDHVDGLVTANATLLLVTLNGESYVRVRGSSNNVNASGIASFGAPISVQPGERYLIRAKGYKESSNAVVLNVKYNGNTRNEHRSQLSPYAGAEMWIEHKVTIPAGCTSLDFGMVWTYVSVGDRFFLNELEVIQITPQTTPEYQYFLKDHLGNVRVTFTTKNEVDQSLATLETQLQNEEQSKFVYYDEAVRVNSTLFDHTNSDSSHYSARLSGTETERYGLAKSLSVMPGDTVKAEVYVKYMDVDTINWTTALSNFVNAIAIGTAPPGTVVDGGALGSTGGATPSFVGLLDKGNETGNVPKAYLNYLLFDRDYNFLDGGFVPITEAAREYGQDGMHEKLQAALAVSQAGYVYIYLSNDTRAITGQQIDVFFDDFEVKHVKSPVVQMDDYYPFGLTFSSYSRENSVPNELKFQGQEHVDDLNLGWDSFKWRNHQPDLGRFFNIDPLADDYFYNSPYAFSENKVTSHVEIEGLESQTIHGVALQEEFKKAEQALMNAWNDLATSVEAVVTEALRQHHEDIDEVRSVSEEQTDPQATDTKWLGSEPVLFNKDAVAKGGSDRQVMVTEGGQTKTQNGTSADETHVHEVRNVAPVDTTISTGNVGPGGETYNSFYITRGSDTLDNRHYVPADLMPKKTATKVQN